MWRFSIVASTTTALYSLPEGRLDFLKGPMSNPPPLEGPRRAENEVFKRFTEVILKDTARGAAELAH